MRISSFLRRLEILDNSQMWKDVAGGDPPSFTIVSGTELSFSTFDEETSFSYFSREMRKIAFLTSEDTYFLNVTKSLKKMLDCVPHDSILDSVIPYFESQFQKILAGDGSMIWVQGGGQWSHARVVNLYLNGDGFHSDLKKEAEFLVIKDQFEGMIDVIVQSYFVNLCTLMMHFGNFVKHCESRNLITL